MICTLHPSLFGRSNREERDGRGNYHLGDGRGEMYTGFRWGNPRERDHLEDPRVDGRIILRWIFRKLDEGYGLIRLRIGTGGGHL